MNNMLLQGAIFTIPEGLPQEEYTKYCQTWIIPYLELAYHAKEFNFFFYISGIVFRYLDKHAKECMDVLKEIAKEKRIEILNGMFYDAAPSLQQKKDAKEQLEMLSYFLSKHKLVDTVSKGVWITSGTYENSNIIPIYEHGKKFLMVDPAYLEPIPTRHRTAITECFGKKLEIFPFESLTLDKLKDDTFIQNTIKVLQSPNSSYVYTLLSQYNPFEDYTDYFQHLKQFLQHLKNSNVHTMNILPTTCFDKNISEKSVTRLRSSPYGFDSGESFQHYLTTRLESRLLYTHYLHIMNNIALYRRDKDRKKSAQQDIRKLQNHFVYWWNNGKWGIQNSRLRLHAYQSLGLIEKSLQTTTTKNKKIQIPLSFTRRDYDMDGNDEIVINSSHIFIIIEIQYGSIMLLQRKIKNWNYLSCFVPYTKPSYPATVCKEAIFSQDTNILDTIRTQSLLNKQSYSPITYKNYTHNNQKASLICSSKMTHPLAIEKEYIFSQNAIQIHCRLNNTSTHGATDAIDILFLVEFNLSFLSANKNHLSIAIDKATVSSDELIHEEGNSISFYNLVNQEKLTIDMSQKVHIVITPVYGTTDIEQSSDFYQHHSLFIYCPYTISLNSYNYCDINMQFSSIPSKSRK